MHRILIVLVFLSVSQLQAGADSSRSDFRLKGIDFKFGGASLQTNYRQTLNVLKAATPVTESSRYLYNTSYLSAGRTGYAPARLALRAVFSNDKKGRLRFIQRSELLIGLGFDIDNAANRYLRFDSICLAVNPNYAVTASLNYTYQCQYAEFGYQVVSKPFLTYFALFAGLNAGFGLNTYKQIDMTDYYQFLQSKAEEVFNAGFLSTHFNVGIKYNLSCELNLFAQYDQGLNVYGKPIGGMAWFNGGSFGLRYKLIDEQDRPDYLKTGFW